MKKVYFLGIVCLLTSGSLLAQAPIDARSAGMGFSNAAAAQGLEHLGQNPAALALMQNFNFELNLLSLNATVFNNSISKSQYDKYFTTGDTLSDADLNDILNSIPQGGWRADFGANVNAFAMGTRNFSLSVTGVGSGYVTLPRELYELATQGNSKIGQVYSFNDLDGQGWGGVSGNLSISIPFRRDVTSGMNLFAFGFTGKYMFGLGYYEVLSAKGNFFNEIDNVRARGTLEAKTAQRGAGYGVDFGVLFQFNHNLTLSLAAENIASSIKWTGEARHELLSIEVDSLAFNLDGLSFPGLVEDSNYVKSRTTTDIPSFTTTLPTVVNAGFAYHFSRRMLFTGQYTQALSAKFGLVTKPRVALGTEITFLPFLPLRAGVAFGGRFDKQLALGTGLNLKFWYLDVAAVLHGSLNPNQAKGVTLAATSRFRF